MRQDVAGRLLTPDVEVGLSLGSGESMLCSILEKQGARNCLALRCGIYPQRITVSTAPEMN